MTQHKENVLPQPASPAAFFCTFLLHKQKIKKAKNKKISKFSILKKEEKKGAKKEPKKEPNRKGLKKLKNKERRGEK